MYRYRRRVLLLGAVCIALHAGLVSANDERQAHFISVQLENDSFDNDSDGYYTHGIEVSLLRGEESPPGWLSGLASLLPFYQSNGERNFVSYTLGQKIFTPRDTKAAALLPDDRPYAGYLYASAAIMSRIEHEKSFDSGNMLEVTLGLVGPSAMAEQTQNTVHRLLGYPLSQGWDNQLRDEPVVGMSYSRLWRMVRPTGSGLEYGVNPHLSVALGNAYTYGAAGLLFRLGDNLRRDLNPPSIRPGFPGVSYYQSLKGVDWYIFAGHEVRSVAHNIFLEGNTFGDSHHVVKEPFVGDTQYGIVFVHRDIRLSFSTTQRTKEFKGQQGDTVYRAINVSFRY